MFIDQVKLELDPILGLEFYTSVFRHQDIDTIKDIIKYE